EAACENFSGSLIPVHEKCFGSENGSLEVVVTGGTPPYAFNWSTGQSTAKIENLASGNYEVSVTDANQNVIVLQETIISPEQVEATGIVKQASCLGNDGAISLNVLGGEAPYDYQWNNGATAKDISGLSTGNYAVTITDNNGCTV